VTRAAACAALAGGCAVLGLWELLAALEVAGRAGAGRALAPLVRAGRGGAAPTAPERRRLAGLAAGSGLLAGWLLAGPVAGAVAGAGAPGFAVWLIRARRRRWRAALARDAPAAARAIADALGAGHSVRGAIAEGARGLGGVGGAELHRAARSLALGAETDAVVEEIRARAASEPWETTVAAISLQRRAGGDLAGLLREIAATQEEAVRMERDARAATAQARFTGTLVCSMPLAGIALGELVAPAAVNSVLRAPASAVLGGLALLLQVGSLLAIRRLARLTE
jgi:tight adherence protein B